MSSIEAIALSAVMSLAVGSTAFADVQLSIREGQISIVASDATVGQILSEWARIGRTTIVNLERIPGEPVTIELTNVSEERALDVLLRRVSGYVVALRPIELPNASRFDRIVVMPPSVAPPAPASATRAAANVSPPAVYQTPASPQQPAIAEPDPDDENATDTRAGDPGAGDASATGVSVDPPPVSMAGAVPPPDARAQVVNSHRQALETVDPREFKLPMAPPGVSLMAPAGDAPRRGVARPGMIVQPAPKPRPPGGTDPPPIVRE